MSSCQISTKQTVKSLVSSCDGISSCVFLKDNHLATTSFNGHIETWDIGNGCRWDNGFRGILQKGPLNSSLTASVVGVWINSHVSHLGLLSLKLTRMQLQQALLLQTWSTWLQCPWTPCWRSVSAFFFVRGFDWFCFYCLDWFFFCGQVWSATKGNELATWLSPGPLNCVSFQPEDNLLAAGCWNGSVILWNWLQNRSDVVSSQ